MQIEIEKLSIDYTCMECGAVEAGNLVDNKGWSYCPKWKWKEARGTNKNKLGNG